MRTPEVMALYRSCPAVSQICAQRGSTSALHPTLGAPTGAGGRQGQPTGQARLRLDDGVSKVQRFRGKFHP